MSKKKAEVDYTEFRNLSMPDPKIDATDPKNISSKILPERESRRRILTHARMVGCEKDILLAFAKYDKLMKNCTNQQERLDIGKMGAVEIYKILGGGGELYVNNELVCKDN
jgi:hypothetical protein